MAGAALEIAGAIKRLQHFFAEFGRLAQNRLPHVGGGIAKAGKIVVAVDLKHIVEQEADVFQGGFIARHGLLPAGIHCVCLSASALIRLMKSPLAAANSTFMRSTSTATGGASTIWPMP